MQWDSSVVERSDSNPKDLGSNPPDSTHHNMWKPVDTSLAKVNGDTLSCGMVAHPVIWATLSYCVEGWHNALKSMFLPSHPSVWVFLRGINKDISIQRLIIIQADTHNSSQPKKKYRQLAEKLRNKVSEYNDTADKLKYLRSISYMQWKYKTKKNKKNKKKQKKKHFSGEKRWGFCHVGISPCGEKCVGISPCGVIPCEDIACGDIACGENAVNPELHSNTP